MFVEQPLAEHSAIGPLGVRIAPAPLVKFVLIGFSVKNGVGHGNGHHRVIGVVTLGFLTEKLKTGLRYLVKLETRAYDVSYNGANHK